MAGLAQVQFDAYATALETAIDTTTLSLDITSHISNSGYNAELFSAALADFIESWDTWAEASAVNPDSNFGDSRKRVNDIELIDRMRKSINFP